MLDFLFHATAIFFLLPFGGPKSPSKQTCGAPTFVGNKSIFQNSLGTALSSQDIFKNQLLAPNHEDSCPYSPLNWKMEADF